MKKTIDLHIHTNMSDGKFSPKEIIDEAAHKGISIIAIADHDTIDAYTEDLFKYAKNKNIEIITAVEISTKIDKCGIHVLGYNIDVNDQKFRQELYNLRNNRHIYLHDVSENLRELGYKLNEKKLDKIDAVTKAHIAQDIVDNPENTNLLINTFGYIPKRGEYIETIMNEGCPAYVKRKGISPAQAAKLIRKAGGKVVLAHPVAYEYIDNLQEKDIAKIVDEMKPDGIEANYIYITRDGKKIDDTEKWNNFAKKRNLFTTIGSDFHNKDDAHKKMGLIGDITLDEEIVNEIIKQLLK